MNKSFDMRIDVARVATAIEWLSHKCGARITRVTKWDNLYLLKLNTRVVVYLVFMFILSKFSFKRMVLLHSRRIYIGRAIMVCTYRNIRYEIVRASLSPIFCVGLNTE